MALSILESNLKFRFEDNMEETKVCTKCPQNGPQPITNFARKRKRRSPVCKTCKNAYNRTHYTEHTQVYKERKATRKSDTRHWYEQLKAALRCNRCPENHPATIHFHHIDRKSKEINLCNAITYGWSKERILAEIAKCEVLCANCHAKEHWKEEYHLPTVSRPGIEPGPRP